MNEQQIVNETMEKALAAFSVYRKISTAARASFLESVAAKIEEKRDVLVPTAMSESNLPEARLAGELTRTTNQLKMFASLVREGSWVDASIDNGNTERQPLPKPDIRKMLQPMGPVVVFGASNFPFAFSTAGGDSASVLASGSTLVIKGHPAHPHTSQYIYEAMKAAVEEASLPDGTIQHIASDAFIVGQLLVEHPVTAGVGFTGSYNGGVALLQYAANRKKPIPVFAEMGSINPVVLYPEALQERAEALGKQYAGSITIGMGQFCTNPGLILAIKSLALEQFLTVLGATIETVVPQKMLHEGIRKNYQDRKNAVLQKGEVSVVGESKMNSHALEADPTIVKTTAAQFKISEYLKEEVFGPYSVVVECADRDELKSILKDLDGQLTSTIMATENDMVNYSDIIEVQIGLAGRVLVNDVPTGVEVCNSMVHGGPFPATTDARFTSVGTTAIKRWVRPVCYQGFPDRFLPQELQSDNPLKIWRLVDNEWTNK
ncbi:MULTISPECIES: aldehyde dehydrogenase (NADP(+)) [Chitinophagaceae]